MIKNAYFMSESDVMKLSVTPQQNLTLVSITEPGRVANIEESKWAAPILRLQFHDADVDYPELTLFNEEHSNQVLNWLEESIKVLSGNVVVIVHCYAGISRSAAIAKFIADWAELKNFNHKYTLYNKHVYSTLTRTYWKKITGEEQVNTTIFGELMPFVPGKNDSEEHKKKLKRIQEDYLDVRWERLGGKGKRPK